MSIKNTAIMLLYTQFTNTYTYIIGLLVNVFQTNVDALIGISISF